MQREVARTAIPANVYWLASFHCYASVALSTPSQVDVRSALLIARDSLERACTNVSGWPVQDDRSVVYDALDTLYLYATTNACIDAEAAALLEQAFYYTATPDLIIVPGQSPPVNGSAVALIYSLLTDTYRFRQFTVSSAVIGCLVVSPILICIIACIADRRRRFFARNNHNQKKRDSASTMTPFLDAGDTGYIELSNRSDSSSRSTSRTSLHDSIV